MKKPNQHDYSVVYERCLDTDFEHPVQKEWSIARLELGRLDMGDLLERAWHEFSDYLAL
jgi:hypothetical protein